MKRMLINSLLGFALVSGLLSAGAATALVTIDQSTTQTGPLGIGDFLGVEVRLSWDGAGSLSGVFVSHVWDRDELRLVNAVSPVPISNPILQTDARTAVLGLGAYYPGLLRVGTIFGGLPGDDLTNSARTVQYSSFVPLSASAQRTDEVVTRLTFRVVGLGDGMADVAATLLPGDLGARGDSLAFGPQVAVAIVPEPSIALLTGLGLAGLVASGRR